MIVSVNSEVTQNDGRKSVQVTFTTEYEDVVKHYLLNSGVDPLTYAKSKTNDILSQLKDAEFAQLETKIDSSTSDISEIITGFKYITLPEALADVIDRGTHLESIYRLINLKSIILFTGAQFSNQELSSLSGKPTEEVELYYQRVNLALLSEETINQINRSALSG